MTICKFYQSGSCKFGDQCKYEHVDANGQSGGGGGAPFDPFAPSPTGNRRTGRNAGNSRSRPARDTPQWPLTSVGAHPLSSGNTVTGDMSQEELRVRAYAAAPQQRGCTDEVARSEQALVAEHQQRNNRAPAPSAPQSRAPPDPFAGSAASASTAAQQPIFGASAPAAGVNNAPIFPTTSAPAPAAGMAFNAQANEGFTQTFPQQPPQMSTPPMATPPQQPANPANGEAFSQPAFAFQQVPETAPSFQ